MATVGRPSVLTKELQDQICLAIEVGAYMEVAAAYVGLNKETFYEWMRRGAKHNRGDKGFENDQIYGEFSVALGKALAKSEMRDVVNIDRAAKKNWQASAWKLERRFQKRWGRKDTIDIEHSGKIDTEISAKDALLTKLGSLIAQSKNEGEKEDGQEQQ